MFMTDPSSADKMFKTMKLIKTVLAILLIIGGIFCIINPFGTVATVELVAAIFILSTGLLRIFEHFAAKKGGFPSYSLLSSGVINIIIGVIFLLLPTGFTVSFLSGIITFALIIIGIVKISGAIRQQKMGYGQWKQNLLIGILAVAIAVVFLLLPLATDLLLVVSLGCYLLYSGISLVFLK